MSKLSAWRSIPKDAGEVAGELRYSPAPELSQPHLQDVAHDVIIVGGGLIGLTLAGELARLGVQVIVVDEDSILPSGTRALSWVKSTMEVWDRIGDVAISVDKKGTSWNASKVYDGEQLLINRKPDFLENQKWCKFAVNCPQYYVEAYLIRALKQSPHVSLRWNTKAVRYVERKKESGHFSSELMLRTPHGEEYRLRARYVVDCSGSKSILRQHLLPSSSISPQEEKYLIVDLAVDPHHIAQIPSERKFWFRPPFHDGHTVLMHRQPNAQLRVDFSLPPSAERDVEVEEGRVLSRIKRFMDYMGFSFSYTIAWVTIYGFNVGALCQARDGHLLFAGDSLKSVSPFGARGGNGGIQDALNLAWKLAMVLKGVARDELLNSYEEERRPVLNSHLYNIISTAKFMNPHTPQELWLRNFVLTAALKDSRMRRFINCGTFCEPPDPITSRHFPSTHQLQEEERMYREGYKDGNCDEGVRVGHWIRDGPLQEVSQIPSTSPRQRWLIELLGQHFTLILFLDSEGRIDSNGSSFTSEVASHLLPQDGQLRPLVSLICISPTLSGAKAASTRGVKCFADVKGYVTERYSAYPGSSYLFRPDMYCCGRWNSVRRDQVEARMRLQLNGNAPVVSVTGVCRGIRVEDKVYNAILEARLSTLPHSTDQQNVMKLLLFLAASVSAEDLVSAVERVLGSLDGTTFGDPFVRSKL